MQKNDTRIQVLVVDDSALMRNIVGKIIDAVPDMVTVGKAMNGEFALEKIERLNPDVIVLDIEMPVMNGIEFLKERRKRGINIPVVILSSVAERGARITMEALSLGASDFITKPSGSVSRDIHTVGNQIIALVRGLGERYRNSRGLNVAPPVENQALDGVELQTAEQKAQALPSPPTVSRTRVSAPPRKPRTSPGPLEIIAIGISTGGPNALRKFMAELTPDIGVPIVIVQHMPAGFTWEFAQSLNRICKLEVKEASEGELLKPGRVLVAPGNYHLTVEKRALAAIVHVNQDPPRNGHRPSADVLFASVAREYGNRALGIIMTGMGRDGAMEIGSLYEAGGITLGQDEASSVVYGMPRAAFENGYLHRQVPLSEIASAIVEIAAKYRAK